MSVCDGKCFSDYILPSFPDLRLSPLFLQGTENDEVQTSMALRVKASAYFVLNARSRLLKDESGPGVMALGEEWGFLEVEASDVGLGGPVLCAYLVMASLARRTARVPVPQSRHVLDVPVVNGTAHEVWLGQVLERAMEAMQVQLVLDAVTTVRAWEGEKGGTVQEILSSSPSSSFLRAGTRPSQHGGMHSKTVEGGKGGAGSG